MTDSYLPPEDDIAFLLEAVLGWRALFELPAYAHADPELGLAVLAEGARLARDVIAPLNAVGDREGCRIVDGRVHVPPAFREAYGQFIAGGWAGLDLPVDLGGQALPRLLCNAFAEMVNGGCVAFGMMPCMVSSAANLLARHADPALARRVVAQLLSGEAGATIVITEPQAGSHVGGLRTRAVRRADGSYRITGAKMFITCGDQDYTSQIHHLVLAVTGGDAGRPALTLFLVPAILFDEPGGRNAVTVTGLEHKMGLRASPTCALGFEGAVGYRIGEEGKGLACLFTMMNRMRLEVAVQGVGIAEAATQRALAYAMERRQGGDPARGIVQYPDVRRMLWRMRALTGAMRALVMAVSLGMDLAEHHGAEQVRREEAELAGFLLPVCKAWMADRAFEGANLGIQVMGGHGYITESGIEQYARDSRVLSIYEGTNGIQALDLVGRKLRRPEAAGYRILVARIAADLARYRADPVLRPLCDPLAEAMGALEEATACLLAADAAAAAAGASTYLHLVGHVAGGWMWLRVAAADATASRRTRHEAAFFYMHGVLPEAHGLARATGAAGAAVAGMELH